jgi:23S rRNA (guanine745-N1)-methyltransferase
LNRLPTLPLACSVRGCQLPLEPQPGVFACARGHSYDVARAGYLNLLQPQDRKSRIAGDPPPAVDARARLLDAGIGMQLLESVAAAAPRIAALTPASVAADLGCGTGHLLRLVHERSGAATIGIDLSARAIELASRRAPHLQWVVANADRRLPLLDGSIDLLMSIHARRNPGDAARVIAANGALLVAIPAHDDLVELREAVQGGHVQRDRVEQLVAEHQPAWRVADRWSDRQTRRCDADTLRDLLRSTYRGGRHSLADRIDALTAMDITFASEVIVFRRR